MKKMLSWFCSLAMLLSMLTVHTFAAENNEALHIKTRPCPEAILDYAKDNVYRFILSSNENNDLSYSEIKLGQPFTYGSTATNLYTFPIFSGGKIVYTFRVAYDSNGDICGTMSKFLVDELNKYAGQTSTVNPVLISIGDNQLTLSFNGTTKELASFPNEDISQTSQLLRSDEASLTVTDLTDYLDWSLPLVVPAATGTSRYINLVITEQQGNNSWCSAYVTACILRTLLDIDIQARDLMVYWFGEDVSTTQLFPVAHAQQHAIMCGLDQTKLELLSLSTSQLLAQIDSGYPVYLSMTRDSDITRSHALALRGYSLSFYTWSVWNPWDAGYSTFTIGGKYTASNGVVYYYDGLAIYDFYSAYGK